MKTSRFLAVPLLAFLISGQSAQSQTSKGSAAPIRYATLKVQVVKHELNRDPSDVWNEVQTPVCTESVQIPVYDERAGVANGHQGAMINCRTQVNQKPYSLNVSGHVSLQKKEMFGKSTDVKIADVYLRGESGPAKVRYLQTIVASTDLSAQSMVGYIAPSILLDSNSDLNQVREEFGTFFKATFEVQDAQ